MADTVCKHEGDAGCFPRSAYAFTPSDEPSTWKLRLQASPDGPPDAGIVGAAIAALGKGFRGNTVDLPAGARSGVIAKVRAAWHKCHGEGDELPDVLKMSEDVMAITESDGIDGWQPFAELSFAEPTVAPEWIPLLPKPGKYQHGQYGSVEVTRERNQHMVNGFNNNVYQSNLPIDVEHNMKDPRGAHGWVTAVRQNEDGSVDGRAEWTDLGQEALRNKRFKYTSPFIAREWRNNYGEVHKDVLAGVAMTVRPWFKDQALRPMVMNERGLWAAEDFSHDDDVPVVIFNQLQAETPEPERSHRVADVTTTASGGDLGQTYTEEQVQAFRDEIATLTAERDALKGTLDTQSQQYDELSGKVQALQADARRNRLAAIAEKFHGGTEQHMELLTSLADAFGEDGQPFKTYCEQQATLTKQIRESDLFKEIGSGSVEASNNPLARLDGLAQQYMEKNPGVSKAAAVTAIVATNPELYSEYQAGFPA